MKLAKSLTICLALLCGPAAFSAPISYTATGTSSGGETQNALANFVTDQTKLHRPEPLQISPNRANNFTFVSTTDVHPDNPSATQSVARSVFNDPDIVDSFRADSTGHFVVNGVGVFDITQDPLTSAGPTYTVTWTLDAGLGLEGVYFKGGNQGGNFYSAGELNAGTGDGNCPVTGGSGMFADLSHLDFFTEQVPEPRTAVLLGISLVGFGLFWRFLRQRISG